MNKFLYMAALLFCFNTISAELWTVNDLNEFMTNADHNLVLLDVRTQSEYHDGHINGSINIPHDQILEMPELVFDYKNTRLVVYCRSGGRAGKVITKLEGLGYENIIDISGDMLAWNEAGYPVEINSE